MDKPENSYTTKLLTAGPKKICTKILEEACEVVVEGSTPTSENRALVHEACDLIYHLWVLLGSRGVTVDQLRSELARREGTSGLEEKRNRSAKS